MRALLVVLALAIPAVPLAAQAQVGPEEVVLANNYLEIRVQVGAGAIGSFSVHTTDAWDDPAQRGVSIVRDAGGDDGKTSDFSIRNHDADRLFSIQPKTPGTLPLNLFFEGYSMGSDWLELGWEVIPPTGEHLHVHNVKTKRW